MQVILQAKKKKKNRHNHHHDYYLTRKQEKILPWLASQQHDHDLLQEMRPYPSRNQHRKMNTTEQTLMCLPSFWKCKMLRGLKHETRTRIHTLILASKRLNIGAFFSISGMTINLERRKHLITRIANVSTMHCFLERGNELRTSPRCIGFFSRMSDSGYWLTWLCSRGWKHAPAVRPSHPVLTQISKKVIPQKQSMVTRTIQQSRLKLYAFTAKFNYYLVL